MKRRNLSHLFGLLALLLLLPGQIFAQNLRVEGRVLDELGEGLIGAGVVIQGTTTGTVTDIDGNFVLPSVPRGASLEISCIGYTTQVIQVTGQNITVTMEPDTHALDEAVVVAYGQQKKVTITGAVSAVSGEGLLKAPVASVANALQGNLPGVSAVQNSGMPGADEPVIRIRGVGSLTSAEPLVLVDGVERPFSQLDANEIESISVLKDASATAVFGVRGANGVILVTTKRGTAGKASVSASFNSAVQTVSKFIDFADSYTYGQMHNYTMITDALPMSQWPGTVQIADYTPYIDAGIGLKFNQNVMEHFRTGDMPVTFPNTDWIKYIMKDAAWQEQANVNVNGGTDRVRYFVSAGFLNQDSLFKTFSNDKHENFSFQRLNYRANLDIDVSKRSQISITLGGRMQDRNTMGGSTDPNNNEGFLFRYLQSAPPYAGIGIDEQGRHVVADPNIVGAFDRDALSNYYNLGYRNTSTNALNFDIQYKLDLGFITEGLDFKAKASYNSEYTAQKDRQNGYGSGLTYVATIVDGQEVLRKENTTWPLNYNENKWGSRNWYAEASFDYARKFGEHNVTGLLLYNQSKIYYPGSYSDIPRGYVGLVGRVTYDYATKYLLDLNIGYNGSENFAPGKRYGLFPSVSVGWIPSAEPWWEPVKDVISYLKFRGSWGLVGNDNSYGARFLYLPGTWQFFTGGMMVDTTSRATNFGTNGSWLKGVKELSAGNPNVTWETATKINLGVDAGFFKNRLHTYVDFFWEDRTGILVNNSATLPAVTYLQASYVNEGRVKNHGYEITLNWEDRIGDFHYSISPNFSFARNKVIEMLEVPPMYDYLKRTGLPVGQPFGYELFEFYQPGTEERYKAQYGADMPYQGIDNLKYGDCVYVDLNGDGLIDDKDQHALGYTNNPEITYSLNASFHWRSLDFSMLWTGADHVSRSLGSYYRAQFGSTMTSALAQWVADNSWTEDNTDALLPRISFNNQNNIYDSRAWMIDAKYLRLKNVEIGYTFNKPARMPFFNYIRVYLSGQNLLTFARFDGNDPEAPGSGLDYGIRYPMTRVFNMGVQLNF